MIYRVGGVLMVEKWFSIRDCLFWGCRNKFDGSCRTNLTPIFRSIGASQFSGCHSSLREDLKMRGIFQGHWIYNSIVSSMMLQVKLNFRASKHTWATTWQNQQNECAPSEDSGQPGNPPSLIRVFAVCMKKAWVLSYTLSVRRRLRSAWADAQADLSLRWAHSHFVGFVMLRLTYFPILSHKTRSKIAESRHLWQQTIKFWPVDAKNIPTLHLFSYQYVRTSFSSPCHIN